MGGCAAQVALEGRECLDELIAAWQLFGDNGWGAHHCAADHKRRVVNFARIDDLDRTVLADCLLGEQLPQIGAATATRPEDRGADGDVVDVRLTHQSQDASPPTVGRRRP